MKHTKEKRTELAFPASALASILAVAMIYTFLFANGAPAVGKIGIFKFLVGEMRKPGNNIYGILPVILGSIYVTAGAILVGVPIEILTAVFMARFCPKRLYEVMRPAIDLLAGIPSVVYGFFGLVAVIPVMSDLFGGSGKSVVMASVLLGITIFPTVIGVPEPAINAVPDSYYEGALALSVSHERSVLFVTLPAAESGILAGVILGVGWIIDEIMAAIVVIGNQPRVSRGTFQGARTLAANIMMEMRYTTDLHQEALVATAVVLFVFILLVSLSSSVLNRRVE